MKKTAKKLLSMALVLVMVLSLLPVTAMATGSTGAEGGSAASATSGDTLTNEYGFQITVPDNFERDTAIPYGSGTGPVNLSPVKEIGVFESSATTWHSRVYNFTEQTMVGTNADENLFSSSEKFWNNARFDNSNGKAFHPSTALTTQVNASTSSPLGSASGTSLDPGGDGRDNVLAYYGRNRTSGQLQLYIYPADRANHDTVTGAAWTGSAESSYSWMSETTPYNNEGYLSIVSGDFDGDGKDTLVLYDPAAGNLQLREFKVTDEINGRASQVVSYALGSRPWLAGKFGLTPNQIQKMSGGTAKARNTAMVQLAAGDIDGDQKDELIVTLSLPNMVDESSGVNYIADRSSVLMVLDKNPSDKYFTCNWFQQLAYVYDKDKENTVSGTKCWWMRAASSVVGDVDGDGKAEILTVGVGSNDNGDDDDFFRDGYFAVITEYNGGYSTGTSDNTTLKELSTKGYYIPRQSNNDNYVGTDSGDVNCMSPVSLGLVRFDGTGTQPYVVIRGTIYKYDAEQNNHRGGFTAAKTNQYSLDDMLGGFTIIRQPIVGNFDGNMEGREQIFFAMSYRSGMLSAVMVGGWYYDGNKSGSSSSNSVMEGTGLRSSRWWAVPTNVSEVVLTAPDADTNDGYIAKFKDKEYTCVDPEVMAILEAAPYFEDLKDEYRETLGGTTFGKAKGSGSGSNVQGSTRAGAYVSYEQDISIFGIKIGSWEVSSEFVLEWSWELEKETYSEYTMEFDGGRDSNQVVLICTPVTVYHYEVYDVADGKWKPMDVTIADDPVYSMLSVEEYNAIAELRGDPTIGSDIVCAVPGQPDTYRTSTSGLKNVYTMNQLTEVGHGSSTVTQSITSETTHTFSDNLVHSIDVSAGMGPGGFVVGVTGGLSIGGGWSETDTSSLTRSGTVGQVPDGYPDYSFNWKFITWDATFGEGNQKYTVPVLGYIVTDVKQPPSMPQNVEADPGTDSVTLTWEPGFKSAVYYEVCRYVPNDPTGKFYYVRGTVNGSEAVDGVYTFTDTGLEPGTQYQYTLRAVGFLGSTTGLLYSNYIEPVAVVTASTAGTPRIVNQTKGEVGILPNASTTFEVVAVPAISTNSLSFQWQSRSAGENAWKNMTNQTSYQLTVTGTAALDGTDYRCMVAELTSGSLPVFIYSEPVTLKVGKADSTAVLTASDTSGSADHSEEKTAYTDQQVVSRYKIQVNGSAATVYEAYTTTAGTSIYRNVADGKYYQLTGLNVSQEPDGTGVYSGTATGATELTALAGYLANGSKIIANINDLHGTVQETATFDAAGNEVSADTAGAVVYNVFTATGVAVQGTDPDLQQSTLTLYQKADGSDTNYYVAFYETQSDGTQVLKLHNTALQAVTGDTTSTNFTYLSGTLQPSWTTETQSITVGTESKNCEVYTDGSVTVYKYTKYDTVPVLDDEGNQIGDETVTVVVSETYYYETTSGEGESAVTYTALTGFDQGQQGIVDNDAKTVSGIVTPSEVQHTIISVPTTEMKQVPGDEVTLSVNISATGTTPSGNVSFQITNTTTGLTTTRTATVSNGTASVTWTPSTEGVYTIRAVYGGSSTAAAAASNTITYYATAGSNTLYDIRLPAAPQYGDTITPSLFQGTTAENMSLVTGAVFTYHKYLGTGVIGTDSRGYETTGTTIPDGGVSSLLPGDYLIKTTVTVGTEPSTISKALAVSKRAINVTVPDFTVSTEQVSSINWAERLKAITVTNSDGSACTLDTAYGTAADGYSNLFTLANNSLLASAGNYDLSLGYKDNTIQSDFLSKYTPTIKRGVATVTAGFYTVTYTAGINGTLAANNITAGSQGFATGASIKKSSKLLFTATPDDGFQVSKWTVKDATTGTELTTGFTTGTNSLTLNALSCNLDVTVEFSNETHKVTFGPNTTGNGTVTATQFGKTLVSGDNVVGGSSVTFTATPASGYVVKQWSVAKNNGTPDVQLNPDGATAYTGTTLTLDNIDADTAVIVTFEPAGDPLQVTYSAVKDESGSLVAANDVVSFTADGLENGTAVKGSTVKLTATVTPGTAILEWRVSTNGTDWTTVAGSVKEYTIYSLQEATQIRVLVTTSAASYPVTFSMVDGNGAAVSDAGTLTATYNGGNISSGTNCMAYTTVVLTYTESENGEFVSWNVTGTTGTEATDPSNGKVHTYTIDSLDAATEVKAEVREKPQITITPSANGTITFTGTKNGLTVTEDSTDKHVDFGSSLDVTLEPDTGYEVTGFTVDGMPVTAAEVENSDNRTYTYTVPDAGTTLGVTFSAIPAAEVTYSVVDTNGSEAGGTNGTLTASVTRKGMSDYAVTDDDDGTETVCRDSVVTFTATPAVGYKVSKWFVDGVEQSTAQTPTLTITDTTARDVQVQFDPVGEAVTYGFDPAGATGHQASLGAVYQPTGGSESEFPNGNKPAANGTITFTVSGLAEGYKVEGWYVNGVKVDGPTGLTYAYSVTANVGADVKVRIIRSSYTVTFSGENGTVAATADGTAISSGGSVVGDTEVIFTATPVSATGYTFAGWTVDGAASEETTESLTMTITKDTVVKASYTLDEVRYTVTHGVIGETGGTLTASALDAEDTAAAGSNVVFKATPADGYRVKGWYSDAAGNTPIPGTDAEQNSYTISSLTGPAAVYVKFEPIPTYDITVNVTGLGTVTATVNGEAAEIPADGILTVSRYDDVVFTAVPDSYQYLTGWTLDGTDQGNGSMTLTLTDVTEAHTVAADFAASQLVEFRTVCGENGSLTAQAGYGETLSSINASTGISLEKGKKVVLTVVPDDGYMVAQWTVNGVVQKNLSNTLTIENLSEATVVTVEFETPATMHTIPTSGANAGYTISNIIKTPSDYGEADQIRDRGTVTFTVTPDSGKYLTELTVNGTDCLTSTGTGGSENQLTIRNNGNGSYTITVANVKQDITLTAASLKFQTFKEELSSVPTELQGQYTTVAELQTALRTQVQKIDSDVSASQTALVDIVLKYTMDGGSTWDEADKDHFPTGGITVTISYEDLGSGVDNTYDFTVIHMFTTNMNGHTVGDTEHIMPVNKNHDGISFTVTSLSPFAIGWTKYTAPTGGGGGGGGGAAAPAETIVIKNSVNGKVTVDNTCAEEGDKVTLTVTPDKGYTLETLTVTDENGNELKLTDKGNGKYTFTMPASEVTIKATFMEDNSMLNFFVDVPADAYYYDAVLWAAKEGITGGVDATHFAPYATCTRAQAVTFLWRAAGSPAPENSAMPFTDVAEGSYYHDAVLWAVENGITKGTTDTTFSPNAKCTRAQIVTFLYRSVQARGGGMQGAWMFQNPFTDVSLDSYYGEAVMWAVANGVTGGTTATTFSPNSNCTRAQIVTFLYRSKE